MVDIPFLGNVPRDSLMRTYKPVAEARLGSLLSQTQQPAYYSTHDQYVVLYDHLRIGCRSHSSRRSRYVLSQRAHYGVQRGHDVHGRWAQVPARRKSNRLKHGESTDISIKHLAVVE